MATESELIDLLDSIGDRAPTIEHTLGRLTLKVTPAESSHRRWLPISAAVAAVAAVAVSVLVSVAMRGDGPNQGAATAGPGPTADRATYPLPLDAYYASATQMRTLQRAQFALAQRCAKARGVTVPTADIPAGDPRPAFLSTVANDIRPLTLTQARTIGYDLYPSGTSAVAVAVAGLTSQQLEIFQGWTADMGLAKPTDRFLLEGGCLAQASRTLLKGATPVRPPGQLAIDGQLGLFDDDEAVNNVYLNLARSGETSPAMGQAQQRWASCMAAHNYPGLRTTTDTIQSLSNERSASAERQAVQDVQCKQSTGFMTVFVASMTKAQNAVIAAHPQQLAGFKKRLDTRMANAAKALK